MDKGHFAVVLAKSQLKPPVVLSYASATWRSRQFEGDIGHGRRGIAPRRLVECI
jgi:hypothetical protein